LGGEAVGAERGVEMKLLVTMLLSFGSTLAVLNVLIYSLWLRHYPPYYGKYQLILIGVGVAALLLGGIFWWKG
jgi:hypothetical protein